MSAKSQTLIELPWLPRLADDFRARLQAVEQQTDTDWGLAMRLLAQQQLGLNQAIAMARALKRLRGERTTKSLSKVRLGLVSNATVDFIVPFLEATALRYGLQLEVMTGTFGQQVQEALDPSSAVNAFKPDLVLLAIDHRGLPFRQSSGSSAAQWPDFDSEAALTQLRTIRKSFRENCGALCIVQTLPAPAELILGSLDAATPGTLRATVQQFNAQLAQEVVAGGDLLLDVDWLAQSIGLDQWYDDRHWHLARMPFSQQALGIYADFVIRLVAAVRGKARKCLVLDLDNTLWGGVIGDDGMEGIALSQGDPRGEAHRAVQAAALELRRRGVVLAVCSKNTDEIAREPFRSHPGMILKESDIAVFVANWEDKASNLERIAQRLELGLDALVFLDDNPVERAQVREALPQVAVPELGEDPSGYVRTLLSAGYFESVAFTREDLSRADQYKSNADRLALMETSRDLGEFLRSLNMEIRLASFNTAGRKRITQLINKTNQFNVTTRRYTENQVAELETSSSHYTLQVNLTDRFGDNGMIGVVICERGPEQWSIDTWLMSCRVLNRKVEEAICNRIASDALQAGAQRLRGTYIPTDRNGIVKDLFSKLGFVPSPSPAEAQIWELDLMNFQPFDIPFADRT